jgi:NAD-dependent dihydropyrimidine dehydrogenase PreA subunit
MLRTVITINEDACDGCGQCVTACHEGALALVDGKARVVREDFCDGLAACLGECPQGAIRQERREAAPFALPADHPMHGKVRAFEEVAAERAARGLPPPEPGYQDEPASLPHAHGAHHGCQCPGSAPRTLAAVPAPTSAPAAAPASALGNWPVQLRLVPPPAPWLQGADLLVCADCVPFAVPDFHQRHLRGRALVVGCPKLDDRDAQFEKLAHIFAVGGVRSVTVLRMEVPCCGGLVDAVQRARDAVRPDLPVTVEIIPIG